MSIKPAWNSQVEVPPESAGTFRVEQDFDEYFGSLIGRNLVDRNQANADTPLGTDRFGGWAQNDS